MSILAYIDFRPFLFLGGLPLFIGLFLLVCRFTKVKLRKRVAVLISAVLFTTLFTVFLTGFGPFVGQEETREYLMTWEIKPSPSNEPRESEVVLSFVDFPSHFIGEYSDELAAHLREKGDRKVNVIFEVTSDYGRVRGFHEIEIGGFREWKSESGYAGSTGSPIHSPWD